jgi:Zn-dependent protease with chaperone function
MTIARASRVVLVAALLGGGACSSIEQVSDDLGVKRLGEKLGEALSLSPDSRGSRRGPSAPGAGALDWRCDTLVEPFELVDNAVVLARIAAERGGGPARGGAGLSNATKASIRHTNWMPLSVEKTYGENLHKQRTDIRDPGGRRWAALYKQGNEILARLVPQIPEPRPVEFRLFVTEQTEPNAEAYPGGYLYVSRGALERGEAYASFALAHEIGHVTKRHTTRELQARVVDSAATLDQLRVLMGLRGPDPSVVNRQVQSLRARFLSYSRDQESEADACAIRLIAGIPGGDARRAADAFLKELGDDPEESAVARGRLSTHPGYRERRGKIGRVLGHYARRP